MPDMYRGRACYVAPVQAADYYLRAETGLTALDAFALVGAAQNGEYWAVRFTAQPDGVLHTVHLAAEQSAFQVYKNTGDTTSSHVTQYRLVRHTAAPPD